MASIDATRFGDLCRLCAAKIGPGLGINIFESEGATRQIHKKIASCLSLQVCLFIFEVIFFLIYSKT